MAVVAGVSLSGCAAGTPLPSAPGSTPAGTAVHTTAPAAPVATPTAAASTPTSTPAATALTCDQLVDPAVLDPLLAAGLEADPLWPDQTELYGTRHQRFTEFGGVTCRWGKPNTDNVRIYSYAPTTPQQSALLESELTAAGYAAEVRDRGIVYIDPVLPGSFILVTGDEVFETHGVESFDDLLPYRDR